MQLGHIYSITVFPCTCICPYSTVAPSVVATHVPSEEGSSEMSVSPTRQAPATGGKCVFVCVRVRARACTYASCAPWLILESVTCVVTFL